jgi:3,4-dihydroxy-2-butanone 4-phosphate synthase
MMSVNSSIETGSLVRSGVGSGVVDLMTMYGYDEIAVGCYFTGEHSSKRMTNFVKDYNFNDGCKKITIE